MDIVSKFNFCPNSLAIFIHLVSLLSSLYRPNVSHYATQAWKLAQHSLLSLLVAAICFYTVSLVIAPPTISWRLVMWFTTWTFINSIEIYKDI